MRTVERGMLSGILMSVVLLATSTQVGAQDGAQDGEWHFHGGDSGFTRYSPLDQIDAGNVEDLEIVWRRPAVGTELQERYPDLRYGNLLRATPLMVDGVLYASNGIGLVEAFNPGTGATIWTQEFADDEERALLGSPTRAVGYWSSGNDARILSIRGPYLYAMDAETGRLIRTFGDGGRVDLRVYEQSPRNGRPLPDSDPRAFSNSSGPLVVGDVVVLGGSMADHPNVKEQDPGDVRAYDTRTGELRWTFRPIPNAGEAGVETWRDGSWRYSGMANVWTLMSADQERGIVYLPTGAPTNDMYGGHRQGDNLYANSIVAVDAATGERLWHFQTVRHDLFDYDNNVAPILADITVDGEQIPALIQLTKQAIAYVLNRVTGEPVWPMVELAVPGSTTPGEWTAPTQPFPTKPAPFDRQGFSIDDLIDFTPELRAEAIEIIRPYRPGPLFTPPSFIGNEPGDTKGSLQLPGTVGGAEWGGGGFDPQTGMLYVPSITAVTVTDLTLASREGMNVTYTRGGRILLQGPQGLPLTKPPYGRITAIDLHTGDHVWMVPNGNGWRDHPAIRHLDLPPLGQGGRSMTVLTSTLLFVSEGDPIMVRTPEGGGPDSGKGFRAFDKDTGEVLWETLLPAGTNGSPMTYSYNGKQYIVLPIGSVDHQGEWVAFALP